MHAYFSKAESTHYSSINWLFKKEVLKFDIICSGNLIQSESLIMNIINCDCTHLK
jgi:hypothetical protein